MELKTLDKYNRQASMGIEYFRLNNEYPEWNIELHDEGHIMDKNKLETIAINGLISWYIENNINIDIYYNYNERLLHFINNPYDICYNDWLKINKLAKYINIDSILTTKENSKHMELMSYDNNIFRKYAMLSWGNFLIDKFDNKLILYLEKLYEYIKENNYWFDKSFYSLFLERNPEINNIGIIYHRLKIILEKYKLFDISLKDIYKIDYITDYIQTIIYTLCINYIININNNINNININELLLEKLNKFVEPINNINIDLINEIYNMC
jgi:hypothetical protein